MIQPYNRLKVILHGWQKEAVQTLPSIKLYCDYIDEIAACDGILYKDTASKYHKHKILLCWKTLSAGCRDFCISGSFEMFYDVLAWIVPTNVRSLSWIWSTQKVKCSMSEAHEFSSLIWDQISHKLSLLNRKCYPVKQ